MAAFMETPPADASASRANTVEAVLRAHLHGVITTCSTAPVGHQASTPALAERLVNTLFKGIAAVSSDAL